MNVRPLADRILVRRIEEKETMRGGIIIPDTAKEKPQEGEVVAIGDEPAVTLFRPSLKMDSARTVAVVVPSPATSDVFDATSRTIWAPML